MLWAIAALTLVLLLGIRRVPPEERGVVFRRGRITNRVVEPGWALVVPFLEQIRGISVAPLSVSLPPQSAITKDEIPIQLQASLDAILRDPAGASRVRDWRVFLMSQLQELMKERLEELDFDNLDEVFPNWIRLIREELNRKAKEIGTEITGLQISNLSPRTRPS